MNNEYTGSLISVAGTRAWKGSELTNGFLMRNADGRVAAITQAGTMDASDNAAITEAVPYGSGLVRVVTDIDTGDVNTLKSGVPANAVYQFGGIMKYEPGWAASHPVQNWGVPSFAKFTAITRGIVGFKHSKKDGASDADYIAFLKGDKSKIDAVDVFTDWLDLLGAATAIGSNLYLLIDVTTGFPKVVVGGPNIFSVSVPVGFMLVAKASVFEPENGMVGFELDGNVAYGAADGTTYNVTYDGNTNTGGAVLTDATTYTYGEDATVLGENTLVKTGFTFAGWSLSADGSGTLYAEGDEVEITEDTTLYAVWEAV